MSLNFYVPSVNPIPYHHPKCEPQTSRIKLQISNNSTFCLLGDSAWRPNRTGSPRKISFETCYRKPYNLFGDFIVAKAVTTDDNEYSSFAEEEITVDFDWADGGEDDGALWEGAILYRRNLSITHVEYCTTLERLGLGKLSSELSRSRASDVGLRITKAVKEHLDGTPVLISVDVTRKKEKLRLDGIIKTVITLSCYRCEEPAAESIFANFSLLLTDEPIEEPEILNLGTIYGNDRSSPFRGSAENEEDEDEESIDPEDRLYFPPEEKEIDISKHIRDVVHLEITIDAVCDPKCRGVCLECGTNLNSSACNCREVDVDDGASYGPLGHLKKKLQQK